MHPVDQIIADLTDRRGLRQEWEQIDPDIQQEIRKTWKKMIDEAAVEGVKEREEGRRE